MDDDAQMVQLAQVSLTMAPDGKSAICSFNLMGTMITTLVVPEGAVEAFIQQRIEAKRTALQVLQIQHGLKKERAV